jgi:hypothetical protein
MSFPKSDDVGGFRNLEDERFDFPDVIRTESSGMSSTIQMVQSIALSRPFLLAVIAFLIYRLWVSSRGDGKDGKANITVADIGRSSIQQERLSLRKSQRPNVAPPVTMASTRK